MRLRRHQRRRAALVGLITAALLAGCTSASSDGAAGGSSVETRTSNPPPTSAAEEDDNWRSTEIVDGDTLYVSGPLGELEVRIIGVNTPESGECFSEEATDALAELVTGNDLVLVADRSDVDQFGRALRYVETTDGVDVGAELVANGFAIARRYPPDDARSDTYAEMQRDAQREGRGLWAPDACGSSDLDGVDIVIDVNADAPGDDGVNLNGEWVRFTNAGSGRGRSRRLGGRRRIGVAPLHVHRPAPGARSRRHPVQRLRPRRRDRPLLVRVGQRRVEQQRRHRVPPRWEWQHRRHAVVRRVRLRLDEGSGVDPRASRVAVCTRAPRVQAHLLVHAGHPAAGIVIEI